MYIGNFFVYDVTLLIEKVVIFLYLIRISNDFSFENGFSVGMNVIFFVEIYVFTRAFSDIENFLRFLLFLFLFHFLKKWSTVTDFFTFRILTFFLDFTNCQLTLTNIFFEILKTTPLMPTWIELKSITFIIPMSFDHLCVCLKALTT